MRTLRRKRQSSQSSLREHQMTETSKQLSPPVSGQPAGPCAMVIFGASGDLTKRLLLPSLYHLAKKRLLPKEFALVGCAIEPINQDEFRDKLREELIQFAGAPASGCKFCEWLLERTYYLSGDFR